MIMAYRPMKTERFAVISSVVITFGMLSAAAALASSGRHTEVSIEGARWRINGRPTYPAARAEGLLMNIRMVNSVFEDANRPDFDPDENTGKFIARIPEYAAHGVRAFTLNLQGGFPGYEGAVNSAFDPDGSLRKGYLQRVKRVIEACDRNGVVVILGCYYQRQDQILKDAQAVRAGLVNAVRWIRESGFPNVVLEVANEFNHSGFDHPILKTPEGEVELIRLAKSTWPQLLVSTSGLGNGRLPDNVAAASDFLLIHFNGTKLDDIPKRIAALKKYGKPIVCNEDDKHGRQAAGAAELSVEAGASWGFMQNDINQYVPFQFDGIADDPAVYAMLKKLTTPGAGQAYFPPPESKGGWRKLDDPGEIRRIGGMDPGKLSELKDWLMASDKRDFAARLHPAGSRTRQQQQDRLAQGRVRLEGHLCDSSGHRIRAEPARPNARENVVRRSGVRLHPLG